MPDSRKSKPDDPWGQNPFPEGTRAHQIWTDTNLWAKEHLALFLSEMLESMPPEEASSKEFLDHLLKTQAGIFDIWASALSKSAVLTDQAAGAFNHLLAELEKAMVAQAYSYHVPFISKRLLSNEIRIRLSQRKQYWTGKMLKTVREHKEAHRASTAATVVETRPEVVPAVNAENGVDRHAAVDSYIEEVFRRTGRRITRTEIWKSARYKSRTEFERWERNDPKNPNKTAHERFTRILREKPHLK